jgi:hypothetical protein
MRSLVPQQTESLERVSAQNGPHAVVRRGRCAASRRRPALLAAWAALLAAQFLVAAALAAQTPATPAPAPAHAPTRPHKKPAAAKFAAQPAEQPAPAPAPAAPPLPNWPANKKPAEASVVWDSHGLLIQAANSSLDQILKDVSLKTGVTVEGMGADERIFGTYGPGPARDVLSELLEGSGYNVLMVGDQGLGTPRRIVLSGRPTVPSQPSGNAKPGANNENDTENDQEAQQTPEPEPPQPGPQPQPAAYNPGPAVPVRTPQQIFQERQQQLQQMQQQQQRNNLQIPQN